MANAVEVPKWLKKLPLAPEFHPTETEFADPIAYISKIEKEASVFGICKIVPPIPKPSKKYVFSNLNKSLLKRPDLGPDVNTGRFLSNSGSVKDGGEARAVFTTRQQELGYCAQSKKTKGMGRSQQPPAQKQVWQSGELYTLEQFEAKAKAFSRTVLRKYEEVTPLVVETLFWQAAAEKPIYIEYANDVPGSGFSEPVGSVPKLHGPRSGRRSFCQTNERNSVDIQAGMGGKDSGVNEEVKAESTQNNSDSNCQSAQASSYLSRNILPDEAPQVSNPNVPLSDHEWQGTAGWKLSNSPWNLQVISRSAGSLTRFMLDDIPGVTSPMVYIGMLFSWFAWHVEDHELHSLNFLHFGSSKTWYSVPGDYAFDFEEVIRCDAYGGDMDTLGALAILGQKTTLLSPQALAQRGLPCCRLVQHPGEFVVTFPRAYHIGFSHGFNCGEAANFGTSQWLKVAKEAAVRRTTMDQLPMLSHQQLLYLLSMSFVSRLPSVLIPGVRSSRLRNRLREERELLVKRALIKDILEENVLLNALQRRDLSLQAVLWNSGLLPSYGMQISQKTWISSERTTSTTDDQSICLKGKSDLSNSFDQLELHLEMTNDLDIVDLSRDFEINSGALQCVACGILGFPFMCVIQPSEQTSNGVFPASCPQRAPDSSQMVKLMQETAENSISATPVVYDESWNTSCGFLRPRLFCLEHAVQTQELLLPKGGLNMLVICHSDYQKIKPNAAMIAEEIGCSFDCKEVSLEAASAKDLNLINLAIDDGKEEQCHEDWTSNLGVSLKHFVQMKKSSPAKEMEHTLKLRNLFSIRSPSVSNNNISVIEWSSRKFRTKGKWTRRSDSEENSAVRKKDVEQSCCNNETADRGDLVKGNADVCTPRNGKVLLQYFRRRYRNRTSDFSERRKDASDKSTTSEVGNIGVQEDAKSESSSEQLGLFVAGKRRKLESGKAKDTSTENSVVTEQKAYLAAAVAMEVEPCTGTSASTASDCSRSTVAAPKVNETSDAEDSCVSTFASPNESMSMNNLINGAADLLHMNTKSCEEQHGSGARGDCGGIGKTGDVVNAISLVDTVVRHDKENMKHGDIPASCELFNGKTDVKATAWNSSLSSHAAGFVRGPCEGLRPRNRRGDTSSSGGKMSKSREVPEEEEEEEVELTIIPSNMGAEIKGGKTQKRRVEKCPYRDCGKRFSSHSKFISHQREHEKEMRVKCPSKGCLKTFGTEAARRNHIRICETERHGFKCEMEGCGHSFRFESQLNRHRRRCEGKPT